jgi:hypothetical protein
MMALFLPTLGISAQPQVEMDRPDLPVKVPKKIAPRTTPVPQNVEKPDLAVTDISAHASRGGVIWDHVKNLYVNEPMELDVTVKNIFAYEGQTRKNFKIKAEFRYGYSGPVHKEKTLLIRKNLEPGESVTQRIVYGKVKGTPDVLYVKVTADADDAVEERNENNNVDEIEIRITPR